MKRIFPAEFADLLNSKGIKLLTKHNGDITNGEPVKVIADIIRTDYIDTILKALDKQVYPNLKKVRVPIAEDWKAKTKKNFTEALGNSMHFSSQLMNSKKSLFHVIANDTGLYEMLHSESYKRAGEVVMNKTFGEAIGKQVICYEDGDYVSPHTDYFPEYPNLKKGYYDIHLMLSNKEVKHQWLIYEKNGYLQNMADVSCASGIAVYHLPFWHQVTPLASKNEKTKNAKRWLFLGSFEQ